MGVGLYQKMLQKNIKNRTVFIHDNLEILQGVDSDSIDLIYLDPPFNKNKKFVTPIGEEKKKSLGMEKDPAFNDIFKKEDIKKEWLGLIAEEKPILHNYIQGITEIGNQYNKWYLVFMAIRLIEMHRILKDTGSLYLHCDPTMSHYLKLLLDIVFGEKHFKNEIIWHYRRWTATSKRFQKLHDIILFYTKSSKYNFNLLRTDYTSGSIARKKQGVLHRFKKGDKPFLVSKKNISEIGVAENDVWQIPFIAPSSKERTGYPTQKPLALLDKIIRASTNKGDVVLDPFCGCATTCIASENLSRQWIGVDISNMAKKLVNNRLKKELEAKLAESRIQAVEGNYIPVRTDQKQEKITSDDKKWLFGNQECVCNGCNLQFPYKIFEIDHIQPKSKGGGDNIENLQLLCNHCNRRKRDKSMDEFLAIQKKEGFLPENFKPKFYSKN